MMGIRTLTPVRGGFSMMDVPIHTLLKFGRDHYVGYPLQSAEQGRRQACDQTLKYGVDNGPQ